MTSDTQTIRVVCIEDDPQTTELIRLILRREGFEVTTASNGSDGLSTITRVMPDVVLLDLMLPGMDGWEIFQAMRAQESTKHIPVIVLTAKAQSIDKVLGLHIAKVDDYLTKPFGTTELIQSVRKVLAEKRASPN